MDTLPEHVAEFVVQLINVGNSVVGVVESLAEALTDTTGEPLEVTRHDVLAMVAGTVGVRLASIPPADFVRASELVEQTITVILDDLHRAAELAGERRRGHRTVRSSHG
ncbi:hypothetical protein OJ997_13335 [Solirubrobacter phytolaccae]|uniref:Uncharacterized protein n=1 Tax=Solirubrobacter phytolaccae TaxID=1404360 RepID=A0A9X3NA60_9ACTN|nr:hypothetical protein [Solirubrobacter phytolaccae]MDA0181284.1 hypothetical protein [Solirubrobacter phytolaccae]